MRLQSPSSPLGCTLNQLIKGCQLAMQNGIFLAKENKEFWAVNEKQKQKQTQSRRQIPHEEDLSVLEAHELIEALIEALIALGTPQEGHILQPLQPHTQPPCGCGICRMPGHRRETCPDRPR